MNWGFICWWCLPVINPPERVLGASYHPPGSSRKGSGEGHNHCRSPLKHLLQWCEGDLANTLEDRLVLPPSSHVLYLCDRQTSTMRHPSSTGPKSNPQPTSPSPSPHGLWGSEQLLEGRGSPTILAGPTWWCRRCLGHWCCWTAALQPLPLLSAHCCCSSPGQETLCPASWGAGAPQASSLTTLARYPMLPPPCLPRHWAEAAPHWPRVRAGHCPSACHLSRHLKENREALSCVFLLRTTDRWLAEATIWCTFSLSCYSARGREHFPVHRVTPASEAQRAKRNGTAVKVAGKGSAGNSGEERFPELSKSL